MKYFVTGKAIAHQPATFTAQQSVVSSGISSNHEDLPNPAELLLGAFAACCLKNIERFSEILKFEYEDAQIEVIGERQEKPTKLIAIRYVIQLKSSDSRLRVDLLHRNLQKFGTIYNTLKEVCAISGEIKVV